MDTNQAIISQTPLVTEKPVSQPEAAKVEPRAKPEDALEKYKYIMKEKPLSNLSDFKNQANLDTNDASA